MKIVRLIICAALLVASAFAQGTDSVNSLPRPYVAGGLSLMPGGYKALAYRLQGGLYWNPKHAVADVFGAYDNGTKSNDGTNLNFKGHDRYLQGFLAYKQGRNFFGAGASWNQLSTTNYTKGSDPLSALAQGNIHPRFGGGHDWLRDNFSLRGLVEYVLPPLHESVNYPNGVVCQGCGNGVQGPEFTVFIPSPELARHLFYRMSVGIYEFHDTITDPTNALLLKAEDNNRHATATTSFQLMYRF